MRNWWQRNRPSVGLSALLATTALVALLGLGMHPRLLLLLPAMLVLLGVGLAWPWLSVVLVRGRVSFDRERLHAGERLEASMELRNRAPWPNWGMQLCLGHDQRETLPPLAPLANASRELSLIPKRRGVFPTEPAKLRTGFPFGLVTATRSITQQSQLIVWPQVFPVATIPDWAHTDHSCGHVETRRTGSEGDTVGVREYRRGDPMRWIHWAQTARHDRFMVREFQATGIPRVRIVLDCTANAHVGDDTDGSFEWAVRIAASLAGGWLQDGAEVELEAGATRIGAAGGNAQRRRVLDALAKIELQQDRTPVSFDSDLATLLVTTDRGWNDCVVAGWNCSGLVLRSDGFGGSEPVGLVNAAHAVLIASPKQVPLVLGNERRGLADVA